MSGTHETVTKLRALNNVNRCALFPIVKITSVAEHSYHVAMLCLFVAEELKATRKVNRELVLLKALCHDVEEAIISDIPYHVKKKVSVHSGKALQEMVRDGLKNAPSWFINMVTDSGSTQIEDLIVYSCDMAELIMYLQVERGFGNTHVDELLNHAAHLLQQMNIQVNSHLLEDIADSVLIPR